MSQYDHHDPLDDLFLTRRGMLKRMGNGFAALGLLGLLSENAGAAIQRASGGDLNPLAPRKPPLRATAKRVHLPLHERRAVAGRHLRPQAHAPASTTGQAIPLNLSTERKTGAALGSPFGFKKYGQSGLEVSDIFQHVGQHGRRPVRHPLDARRRAQP